MSLENEVFWALNTSPMSLERALNTSPINQGSRKTLRWASPRRACKREPKPLTRAHTRTHTHTHTHTHARTHANTHKRTPTHTHSHTHYYTHSHAPPYTRDRARRVARLHPAEHGSANRPIGAPRSLRPLLLGVRHPKRSTITPSPVTHHPEPWWFRMHPQPLTINEAHDPLEP